MNELIAGVLSLKPEAIKNALEETKENDYVLISKLISTKIRQRTTQLFKEKKYEAISDAALGIYNETKMVFQMVSTLDKELADEIKSLLHSLLLYYYPNGMECYKNESLQDIELIEDDIFEAFSLCGLIKDLRAIILSHVITICKETVDEIDDDFESSAIEVVMDVLNRHVALLRVRFPDIENDMHQLKQMAYQCVVNFRSKQIFDIVTSFPSSKPALLDLKDGCTQTNSHKKFAEVAVEIFSNRLLHLGAATSDIVTIYINAIQALNIADESGGLTRTLSPPIQLYLKTRPDLLTTIVERILEDNALMSTNVENHRMNDDDVIRDANVQKELDEKWCPEPLHSHIRDLNSLVRDASDSDALALLLNVYGSIQSFVLQLEREMAHRVRTTPGYSFDNEVKAIELLKRRFGNQIFINCEVILQDVFDSKRLHSRIEPSEVTPLVVSQMYWPELPSEPLNVPQVISEELERFEETFGDVKANRKLKWLPASGVVTLDIEFDGGEILNATVTPTLASVIYLFNDNNFVSQSIVMEALGVTKRTAESALRFWTSNNVLIKDDSKPPLYSMALKKPGISTLTMTEDIAIEQTEEEIEEDAIRNRAQKFKPFALNILQAMPHMKFTIDSYYTMICRFVRGNDFKISKEDFVKLIPVWVDEGWLEVNGERIRRVIT